MKYSTKIIDSDYMPYEVKRIEPSGRTLNFPMLAYADETDIELKFDSTETLCRDFPDVFDYFVNYLLTH